MTCRRLSRRIARCASAGRTELEASGPAQDTLPPQSCGCGRQWSTRWSRLAQLSARTWHCHRPASSASAPPPPSQMPARCRQEWFVSAQAGGRVPRPTTTTTESAQPGGRRCRGRNRKSRGGGDSPRSCAAPAQPTSPAGTTPFRPHQPSQPLAPSSLPGRPRPLIPQPSPQVRPHPLACLPHTQGRPPPPRRRSADVGRPRPIFFFSPARRPAPMLSATRSLGLRSSTRLFAPAPALSARFASAAPAQAGGYAAPKSDVGGPAPKPSDAPAAQPPAPVVQRDMRISNPRTSKKERLIILGSGWGGFTLVSLLRVDRGRWRTGRARCSRDSWPRADSLLRRARHVKGTREAGVRLDDATWPAGGPCCEAGGKLGGSGCQRATVQLVWRRSALC